MRYVALLRGINVGGNKRIKMVDLRTALGHAGIENPSTLLQSGNVVFDSNASKSAIADIVETTIESAFGFPSEVIIRDGDEVASIVTSHPFTDGQLEDPRMAHVIFMKLAPDESGLDELRIANEGPEEITFVGQELFILYPEGSGRSRLTYKAIEKYLGTPGTARNWNTVLKISALMRPESVR